MFSGEEKKTLLQIARAAIQEEWAGVEAKRLLPETPSLSSRKGVFVTLTREGELRGCIGRIESQEPLFKMVAQMAKAAAFNDPRFPPLARLELSKTVIEISILSPLERIKDRKTLEVGRHGLLVRQGFSSGLLLPQVASSNSWSVEEFLSQTCLKAGLSKEAWRGEETELFAFTAEVFSEEDV